LEFVVGAVGAGELMSAVPSRERVQQMFAELEALQAGLGDVSRNSWSGIFS